MANTIRIIVFGRSGVGKTSMINLLIDKQYETANSAMGCTFETRACYNENLENFNNFIFFDTAGLNEAAGGRVDKKKAIDNLIKLLKGVKEGIHLLIFVRKCETLTDEIDRKNYDLIVNHLTNNRIPCLCVNTNAENERNLMCWWDNNKSMFSERKFHFRNGVSVCCSDLKSRRDYTEERNESKNILWNAIFINILEKPVVLYRERSSMMEIVLKVQNFISNSRIFNLFTFNDIKQFFEGTNNERSIKRREFKSLLINEGLSDTEAEEIINGFDT